MFINFSHKKTRFVGNVPHFITFCGIYLYMDEKLCKLCLPADIRLDNFTWKGAEVYPFDETGGRWRKVFDALIDMEEFLFEKAMRQMEIP